MATKSIQLVRGQEIEQVNIEFTPGELAKHRNLLSSVQALVYSYGLTNAAEDLNIPQGNLSAQLNEKDQRRFLSIENLDRLIAKTGDTSVVLYLVEKYLVKRGA